MSIKSLKIYLELDGVRFCGSDLAQHISHPARTFSNESKQTRNGSNWGRWVLLGLWCVFFAGGVVYAQLDQGTIGGVVKDSSGAVIPGAQVTLTNVNTNLALQRMTDSHGVYVFSPIKIGPYKVSAKAPGFQTTQQNNLTLNIQGNLNVVLTLQPGTVSQTVTVSTAPPLLQTQSGSVGQVLSAKTINNTPLNGRNWVFIAQLSAGVVAAAGRGQATGDFSANGQRPEMNDFILDGVDNNVNILDFQNGSSFSVRPPPDALAEFKVQTSDYSAEFGHSVGAVLNASIKSGTNQIHGDVWEYARNTVLDARDWDAKTVPSYSENQFGATLGLPILRNRLFYFGDAEANRITFGSTYTLTVPTPLMREGDFSELLNTGLTGSAKPIQLYQPNSGGTATLSCNGKNNAFCPNQINSVAQNVLSLYPLPNANGGKTYNNYVTTLNNKSDTWQFDQRIDWDISQKDQAYGRFSYNHIQNTNAPVLGSILDGTSSYIGKSQNFLSENGMFSESHTFGANLVNEFRFSYNWGDFSNLQENYNENLADKLGFGGIPYGELFPDNGGLPSVAVSGITAFGTHNYDPAVQTQNIYQILDNVTKILGNHTLHFGVSLQSFRNSALTPAQSRGDYSFTGKYTSDLNASFTGSGVADFLADQINSATISNESAENLSRWYRAAYFEDNWRASPKLTLNLGLRYDYYQPNKEMAGRQANLVVTSAGIGTGTGTYQLPAQRRNVALSSAFTTLLANENVSLQYLSDPRLVTAQKTNFAPRIGFAYQLDAKTVMRGGYGIFYGGLEPFGANNLGTNFPFIISANFTAPNCAPGNCPSSGITLEQGFTEAISEGLETFVSEPGINSTDSAIKTPYTMGYNLTLQRAFSNNLVASVGYVGNVSRHLPSIRNLNEAGALQNPANSAQFAEPFPGFGGISDVLYNGVSTYDSLQTTLQKRYANGLSFLATYTLSHALDNSGDPLSGGIGDRNIYLIPVNLEYTNSSLDIRNRFTFNGYYQLPFGKGRAYLNRSRLLDIVAGGWATNVTFRAQSGSPFTVGPNISTASGGSARANLVRDPFASGGSPDPTNLSITCAAQTRTRAHWYNPCAFANPLSGSLIPRTGAGSQVTGLSNGIAYLGGRSNRIYGPGYERIDMSVFKNFQTWRSQYLQFRADIFNVLNHPSWANPSIQGINTNAGQITGPRSFENNTPDARFFQLSVKYVF